MAPVAVEWFAEASPKLHTVTASDGQAPRTPSLRERCRDRATPSARGRCEAMVEVWGITASWLAAEDLVAASGDGVLGGGHDAQQHIPQRGRDAALTRSFEEERSRTVVQQRRVRDPERRCHGGIAFVPGRPDRVEPPALGSQPPGREVQVPAPELGVEDVQAALRGRGGPGEPGPRPPTGAPRLPPRASRGQPWRTGGRSARSRASSGRGGQSCSDPKDLPAAGPACQRRFPGPECDRGVRRALRVLIVQESGTTHEPDRS